MLTFLVQYGGHGRETVNRVVKVAKKHDLLGAAHAAFALNDWLPLEVYDNEFGVFVRVDQPEELPSGGRVRLLSDESVPASASTPKLPLRSISTAETLPILSPSSSADVASTSFDQPSLAESVKL